jgi:type IV secretion system protein VirD4
MNRVFHALRAVLFMTLAVFALPVASHTALAETTKERILREGKIVIGIHNRTPWGYRDETTGDALGTATEMKAMKNYAGHRLSPWLGHLMVSRSETARPLLTPGEVMQFPPADEIVMIAGTPPIRAKKARYFEDARFRERVLSPPDPKKSGRTIHTDSWSTLQPQKPDTVPMAAKTPDGANAGLRREPELPDHVAVVRESTDQRPADEFAHFVDDEPEDAALQRQALRRQTTGIARQVALDPGDGMEL